MNGIRGKGGEAGFVPRTEEGKAEGEAAPIELPGTSAGPKAAWDGELVRGPSTAARQT